MRVFLAGATGMIGRPLVQCLLDRGDVPVVLTRDPQRAAVKMAGAIEFVSGDPNARGDWMRSVGGCDAVVNLVGEGVFARRWSSAQKRRLRDSRVDSTRNVVEAIGEASSRPKTLVNASATGFYGDVPEGDVTEDSPPGEDFLARLCVDWEAAARAAEGFGTRVALVRVGVVLDRRGGALTKMVLPFKLGVGGPVGRGRQWVSWIHLDDAVAAFLHAVDHPAATGPINGTAPQPLRNKEFSKSLARALHRPSLFPIPPLGLRLALGEVACVVTGGQRVLPTRLLAQGFSFRYSTCDEAMRAIFGGED